MKTACSVGLLLLVGGIFWAYGPMAQLAHYHDFVNQNSWLGVPHGQNVWSNLGLVALGMMGLWRLYQSQARLAYRGYAYAFCLSLLFTGLGSAYYHMTPNDATLLWDRLPIALICVSLLAQTYHYCWRLSARYVLLIGGVFAIWSVLYWQSSGDLRGYLALQLMTVLWLPLWLAMSDGDGRVRQWMLQAIIYYALAKIAELGDGAIYQMSAQLMSGHTLKHVLSTVAMLYAYWAMRQMWQRDVSADVDRLPNRRFGWGVYANRWHPRPPTPGDQTGV